MPWTPDICTSLQSHCVVLAFRDFCINRNSLRKTVSGMVKINNVPDGYSLMDASGAFFLNCSQKLSEVGYVIFDADGTEIEEIPEGDSIDDYCVYLTVKTCALPANIDSDYDPEDDASINRGLDLLNTYYTIKVNIGNKEYEYDFVLDAAANYTELCGCVPIQQVAVDGSFPPPDVEAGDPFSAAVCDALSKYEDGGPLPFDGSIKVVGIDSEGGCKLYMIPESCNLETKQYIADVIAGGQ